MTTSAFVVGYTGAVGSQLTKKLIDEKVFSSLVLIGRRSIPEYENVPGVEQRVVDYDNLTVQNFSDCEQGFLALGTTKGKSGKEGFLKVDKEYTTRVGDLAQEAGVKHFHVVSSKGADANSSLLYLRTKGETDQHFQNLSFPTLTIYRPGTLMESGRSDFRLGEKLAHPFMKLSSMMAPNFITTPVPQLVKAMIQQAKNSELSGSRILNIKEILDLAKGTSEDVAVATRSRYRMVMSILFCALAISWLCSSKQPANSRKHHQQNSEVVMRIEGSAFIVGFTGAIGLQLTRKFIKENLFTNLVLLGRRRLDEFEGLPNVEQRVIDFEKLTVDDFAGHNQAFCALGTTRGKSGSAGFLKVDKEYIEKVARLSREADVDHFHLVSSKGANPNAWVLYPHTKGVVEQYIQGLNFNRLSIYRPGFLLESNRSEFRSAEAIFHPIFQVISYFAPKLATNSVLDVADAMIYRAKSRSSSQATILDIGAIYDAAAENRA